MRSRSRAPGLDVRCKWSTKIELWSVCDLPPPGFNGVGNIYYFLFFLFFRMYIGYIILCAVCFSLFQNHSRTRSFGFSVYGSFASEIFCDIMQMASSISYLPRTSPETWKKNIIFLKIYNNGIALSTWIFRLRPFSVFSSDKSYIYI